MVNDYKLRYQKLGGWHDLTQLLMAWREKSFSMDIFGLRNLLVEDYSSYISSFVQIKNQRIRELVDSALRRGLLWPDPLIQLNPSFEPGAWIEDLVREGA